MSKHEVEIGRLFNLYDLIVENPVLITVVVAAGIIAVKTYQASQSAEDKKNKVKRVVIADADYHVNRRPGHFNFSAPDSTSWEYKQQVTGQAISRKNEIQKISVFNGQNHVPIDRAVRETREAKQRASFQADGVVALLGRARSSHETVHAVLDMGRVAVNSGQLIIRDFVPGVFWGGTHTTDTRQHDRLVAMLENLHGLVNKADDLARQVEKHLVGIGALDMSLDHAVAETNRLVQEDDARVALENARNEQSNAAVDGAPTTSRLVYIFRLVGLSLGLSASFEAANIVAVIALSDKRLPDLLQLGGSVLHLGGSCIYRFFFVFGLGRPASSWTTQFYGGIVCALIGEIVEVGGIILSITGEERTVAIGLVIVIVLGGSFWLFQRARTIDSGTKVTLREVDDRREPFVYMTELIYLGTVVVASFADWRNVFLALPEFPLDLIEFIMSRVATVRPS